MGLKILGLLLALILTGGLTVTAQHEGHEMPEKSKSKAEPQKKKEEQNSKSRWAI